MAWRTKSDILCEVCEKIEELRNPTPNELNDNLSFRYNKIAALKKYVDKLICLGSVVKQMDEDKGATVYCVTY